MEKSNSGKGVSRRDLGSGLMELKNAREDGDVAWKQFLR
jgi:hypothetical protein